MAELIDFGRGPLFRFAILVALLGLARYASLSVIALWRTHRRTGRGRLRMGTVLARTLRGLNPLRHLGGSRWFTVLSSLLFHAGVILVPVLFLGHLRLWERPLGPGLSKLALPAGLADGLTVATLLGAAGLLFARLGSALLRRTSRVQDWLLPLAIAVEFASGYLLAHPTSNPFALQPVVLLHVWLGDALLLATPFTKIVHCAMLPFSHFVTQARGWLVPGAGEQVAQTLSAIRTTGRRSTGGDP